MSKSVVQSMTATEMEEVCPSGPRVHATADSLMKTFHSAQVHFSGKAKEQSQSVLLPGLGIRQRWASIAMFTRKRPHSANKIADEDGPYEIVAAQGPCSS